MSKAWGECPLCKQYTLHYIRTIRAFQDVTKDTVEWVNMWEGIQEMRWVPGKMTIGRRMLRECRDCGKTWWEVLESKILTEEERWPT